MANKKNNPLLKIGTIPITSLVVGLVLAILLSLFVVQNTTNSSHQKDLVALTADNIQLRLNQLQAGLMKQANSMANSIRLKELLTNGDAATRALEETRLREMIPNAIKVRLIKRGEAKINMEINPPFSFTSLDLVNRVEQGELVFPEAINTGGRWIISLAAPIKTASDTTIHGTLFIYFDITAFSDPLAESPHGRIKLIQTFSNTPETEFLSVGTAATDEFVVRKLSHSNWKIHFSPNDSLANAQVGSLVIALIPSLTIFLLALAGTVTGLKATLNNLTKDADHLRSQMSHSTSGNLSASIEYFFADFLPLDEYLMKIQNRINEAKEAQPSTKKEATPPPRVEIEMTQFSTPEGLEIEDIEVDFEEEIELEEEVEEPEIDVSGIFRAYDIRGIVGETLTDDIVRRIGLSIGTRAEEIGEQTIIVAADGRLSSPDLLDALIEGLIESGRDVVNIGFVPTPLMYFATHNSHARSGVMITGSHNPANYNGLKIVLDGKTLVDEEIQEIYQCYQSGEFSTGDGQVSEIDILEDYIDAITDDVVVAQPLKVIVDCGNGIAGAVAPELLGNLGCDIVPLYCDVDGNFPNHHPDPINPDNLQDLIEAVKAQDADVGIALDGDGDRLVAIDKNGAIIWPDRLLMLFAKDVVSRNPGSDVVYDVKCTRHLNNVISGFGGRPIICRSGHSFIKQKMAETDAMLGGEMSGHICFKERWYGFDDGIYSAARLLEIIGSQSEGLAELLEEFPVSYATPEILIPVTESHKFDIVQQVIDSGGFEDATLTTIDGLRVDFSDSWGLVRASNTSPNLSLRFEADDEESLENIQAFFREKLKSINENLTF